jgi:hypothetical protein
MLAYKHRFKQGNGGQPGSRAAGGGLCDCVTSLHVTRTLARVDAGQFANQVMMRSSGSVRSMHGSSPARRIARTVRARIAALMNQVDGLLGGKNTWYFQSNHQGRSDGWAKLGGQSSFDELEIGPGQGWGGQGFSAEPSCHQGHRG